MNEFVEECLREWKRLGVPDPVADEMAFELAADLDEAQTEGRSREEVLGSGAVDARTFAAAWAAEQGVLRSSRKLGSWLLPAAIAAFELIAISGAVLTLLTSPSGRPTLVAPSGSPVTVQLVSGEMPSPPRRATWVAAPAPISFVVTNDSNDHTRTVGAVLLIAGLAGIVLSTVVWLWARRSRASHVT